MQKHITILSIVTVLVATVALAQQPAPGVDATLVIPDLSTLPGVPFDMWIDVQNHSDVTIAVGLYPSFLVRTEQGSFEIRPSRNGGSTTPTLLRDADNNAVEYLELKPGAKQTLPLPIDFELGGPLPFTDARLSPPGRYGFAVRLDRWPNTPPPVAFLGSISTKEVIIDRTLQNESDQNVWQRMLELGHGKWTTANDWPSSSLGVSVKLIPDILAKYPDSNYVPYALLAASFGNVGPSYLSRVMGAINRFPNSPVIEWLHLAAWGRAATTDPLYAREAAIVHQSKRPTTRIRAFGREDIVKPCPPEYDCEPEP